MPRILIVDDEPGIRSMLSLVFSTAGYEVRTASNLSDAIALCSTPRAFDVVLTDVVMPSGNGHDLVRWIMENQTETRCVLMTGFNNIDCHDCPFVSRCRVVSKPFAPMEIVGLIGQVLQEPLHTPPTERLSPHTCAV